MVSRYHSEMRALLVCVALVACKRETRVVAPAPDAAIVTPVVTSDPEPYYVPTDPPLQFDERIAGDDPIHRATTGKCRPEPCSKDVYVTLLVHFTPSGAVDSVTIDKGNSKVGACLAKAAKKAHFDPSPTGGSVMVPYIYKCDGLGTYEPSTKQNL